MDHLQRGFMDAMKKAYGCFLKRQWSSLRQYLHRDIFLWLPGGKTYYYGPDAVIRYLQDLKAGVDHVPVFFTEKPRGFLQEEVRIIETGRRRAPGVARIDASVTWIHNRDGFLILFLFLKDPDQPDEKISVRAREKERYWIRRRDIVCVEASGNNSILHMTDRKLEITEPLKEMEKKLGEPFIKVHRSFLVNRGYIQSLERYALCMENGIRIPVPVKKYGKLKAYLETE